MPHRSIARSGPKSARFPVQLNLLVPELGFGMALLEMLRWLRDEVGENNFARRDASTFDREILAIHLRRPEVAAAFLAAFPKLELANGTPSWTDTECSAV
jgi:hypothetical protein